MKKVMIGTPSHDGRLDVWFCDSVVNAVKLSAQYETLIVPIYMSYDALVQRARNDLVSLAVQHDFDALVFIDSDMQFDPQDFFKLLNYEEDIVGGTVRKKSDMEEAYNVNTQNLKIEDNGLIKVNSVGTGFLKLSKEALNVLWDNSEEYRNEGKTCRMVFEVEIVDGELFSEDAMMCKKLRDLGFDIWIDPTICCPHLGTKKFVGNFINYLEKIQEKKHLRIVND